MTHVIFILGLFVFGSLLMALEIYIFRVERRTDEFIEDMRQFVYHAKMAQKTNDEWHTIYDRRLSVMSEHLRQIHSRLVLPDHIVNLSKIDLGQSVNDHPGEEP